jgi:methylmalonyl-CoA mutase
MMNMAEDLFSEFHSSHRSDWEKQVVLEIKKPLAELPGDHPLYPHTCAPYFSHDEYNPARFNELQSCQRKDTGWLNMPALQINDGDDTAFKIQEKLRLGAQAIRVKAEDKSVQEISDIVINAGDTPLFIDSSQDAVKLFEVLQKAGSSLKGGIAHDPVANWMRTGSPFNQSLSELAEVCYSAKSTPDFYPIMVDGQVSHHAGAMPEQELALVLASFVFYLDKLTDSGLDALVIANNVFFSLSIGTDYLSEIAKLRAFRMLHSRILEGYGCEKSEIPEAFLHAETSDLYHANTMEHTNIIRTTSEAMSAVIGGCNALTIHVFDQGSDFAERIAMNISSIITFESGMINVPDPASGSYFMDNRSMMIAESAWDLFLEIEEQGGIVNSFNNGFIQNMTNAAWSEKVSAMKTNYVMVGVNKYNTFSKENVAVHEVEDTEKHLLAARNLPASWYSN